MFYTLAGVMGIAVGLVLGFFGSGGSILTLPLLTYGLGVESKSAIAMSLAIVGGTALSGFWQQHRQGKTCVRAGLLFGGCGLVGAFTGARISVWLTGDQQMALFALVMLAAAINMLRSARQHPGAAAPCPAEACSISLDVASTLGVAVGFLTGLLGVGGGFLIVPALVFGGVAVHYAIGTSLLVMVMNCAAGGAGYWGKVEFDPGIIAAFLVSSLLASIMGARLGQRISASGIKRGFAVFLLIIAAFVLYKNRAVFA